MDRPFEKRILYVEDKVNDLRRRLGHRNIKIISAIMDDLVLKWLQRDDFEVFPFRCGQRFVVGI